MELQQKKRHETCPKGTGKTDELVVYQIWRRGWFTSGGFCESFDESTQSIYRTKEGAERNIPKSSDGTGHHTEYYIREIVLTD